MMLNVLPFGARDILRSTSARRTRWCSRPAAASWSTSRPSSPSTPRATRRKRSATPRMRCWAAPPPNITTIRPLRDGVIADFEAAERLLSYLIRKAQGSVTWRRTRLVIGIPSGITQVERRAVIDSAYRAKASEVHLVDEPMAAAIGAGLPITEATGSMVVDIGGGTTDIAVISLGGMVYTSAIRTAGNHMDEAIIAFIRSRHGLLIGERTAEDGEDPPRLRLPRRTGALDGSARPLPARRPAPHRRGAPRPEVLEALGEPLRAIVTAVKSALESFRPRSRPTSTSRAWCSPAAARCCAARPAAARGNRRAGQRGRRSADLGGQGRRPDARRRGAAAPRGLRRVTLDSRGRRVDGRASHGVDAVADAPRSAILSALCRPVPTRCGRPSYGGRCHPTSHRRRHRVLDR